MATDGLWDNLFESEIIEIVSEGDERGDSSLQIAERLVKEAKRASLSETMDSPFSVEARKHGITHLGGKEDDITVIVAKLLK